MVRPSHARRSYDPGAHGFQQAGAQDYRTAAPANRHPHQKDINDWRNAHQVALDYENPNRQRLYDIYADCELDAHLSGCIAQRKGKVLQRISASSIATARKMSPPRNCCNRNGSPISSATSSTLPTGGTRSFSWAMSFAATAPCVTTVWNWYRASTWSPNMAAWSLTRATTGAAAFLTARAILPTGAWKWVSPATSASCSNAPALTSAKEYAHVLGYVRGDFRSAYAHSHHQQPR